MRSKVNMLMVLFIGALLPLSTVLAGTSASGGGDVTLSPQIAAYNMLTVVSGVANYTASLVSAANESGFPVPFDEYHQAQALFKKASEQYSLAEYNASISSSKEALALYDDVIQKVYAGMTVQNTSPSSEVMVEAMSMSNRVSAYLDYTRELIEEARAMGVDTSGLARDWHALQETYNKLQRDMSSGNAAAIQLDIRSARRIMDRMQREVVAVNRAMGMAQAKDLMRSLMSQVKDQLMLTQQMMEMMNGSSENLSMLNKNFLALQAMYSQLEMMQGAGSNIRALELVENMSAMLERIVSRNMEVMGHAWRHGGPHGGGSNYTNQTGTSTPTQSNTTVPQNESNITGSNETVTNTTNTTNPGTNGPVVPSNHTMHGGRG